MKTQKIALVTGAARRIGAEIARKLHETGFNVILHCNTSRKEAETLCQAFNQLRENSAVVLTADLNDVSQWSLLVEDAQKQWGRLDVLVNNASGFFKTPVDKVTVSEWNDLLGSNLQAPFFLTQAAMPYLQVTKGCVVNIADIHGMKPMKDYSVYSIAKAGLIMLTQALAKELAPLSVRVNAVAPGPIVCGEGDEWRSDEVKQVIIERAALKVSVMPQDIAEAVMYLISTKTVTGVVLPVDAGRSLFI